MFLYEIIYQPFILITFHLNDQSEICISLESSYLFFSCAPAMILLAEEECETILEASLLSL